MKEHPRVRVLAIYLSTHTRIYICTRKVFLKMYLKTYSRLVLENLYSRIEYIYFETRT